MRGVEAFLIGAGFFSRRTYFPPASCFPMRAHQRSPRVVVASIVSLAFGGEREWGLYEELLGYSRFWRMPPLMTDTMEALEFSGTPSAMPGELDPPRRGR